MEYGWVDPENKKPQSDKEVLLYEDLKLIADDDPSKKIHVVKKSIFCSEWGLWICCPVAAGTTTNQTFFQGISIIFLVSKEIIDFSEIVDLLVPVSCPALSSSQAEKIISSFIKRESIVISTKTKADLISIFSGMEKYSVAQGLKTLINKYGKSFPNKESVNDALKLKKRVLAQSGLLELVDSTINLDQIGGLEQLKQWLRKKKRIIENLPGAQRLGISVPKGVF